MSDEKTNIVTCSITHRKHGIIDFIISGLKRDDVCKFKEDLTKDLEESDCVGDIYDLDSFYDVVDDLLQKYEEKYHCNTHRYDTIELEISI